MLKISYLQRELVKSKDNMDKLKSEIGSKPRGSIYFRKLPSGKGAVQYKIIDEFNIEQKSTLNFKNEDDLKIYISFREYYFMKKKIEDLEAYIKFLEITIKKLSKIKLDYDDLPKVYAMIDIPNEIDENLKNDFWNSLGERQNSFHPENLKYSGYNGKYRSKSESSISLALYANKIEFKYEPMIIANGKSVCPDFVIKSPLTEKVIIWEHFGKMDDVEYNRKAMQKIIFYESLGYFINKNLFLTYETWDEPFTDVDANNTVDIILNL